MVKEALDLRDSFFELVKKASTQLPADVEDALRRQKQKEESGSAAEGALDTILENVEYAKETFTPMCQDTGTPIFHIYHPSKVSTLTLEKQIKEAIKEATEETLLRPNAVNSLTGNNTGDNIGKGLPSLFFDEWEKDHLKVNLLLKGGGSENMGRQYKLPDSELDAGRDMEGVKKCVLDAIYRAQGKACAPGIIGVGVGGDRGSSFLESKEQLFRPLSDTNPNDTLEEMENDIHEKANSLDIGPMGFGGKTTVLGVKIGDLHRLPASYFVSVSYLCWAARRAQLTYKKGEVTIA